MINIDDFLKMCKNSPPIFSKTRFYTYDLADPRRTFWPIRPNVEPIRRFPLANEFDLEQCFMCLPFDVCTAFLYYNLDGQAFNVPFYYFLRDGSPRHRPEMLKMMQTIHSTFYDGGENYTLEANLVKIAWNERILSKLEMCKLNVEKFQRHSLPTPPQNPVRSLYDEYSYATIKSVAFAYLRGDMEYMVHLESNLNPELSKVFLEKTFKMAPMINGTTCVGKSYIIGELLETLKKIDPDTRVLKASKMGRFLGKDFNQVLAMQNQYTLIDAALVQYTSIMNRDPINNLIWRFILKLFNFHEYGDIVDAFLCLLVDISPQTLQNFARLPVVILVDTGVVANRKRMYNRAKVSGNRSDFQRSKIRTYVPIQNMVYGVFAFMCNWPILNKVVSLDSQKNSLKKMIVDKVLKNIKDTDNKLPVVKHTSPYSLRLGGIIDSPNSFAGASTLNIAI